MTDQVFISFSSADQKTAAAVCDALECSGIQCWVSFRNVRPGENYQAAIVQALQAAKAMVLVFSSHTNLSSEVSKELSLAGAFKLAVIPLRIENAMPQGALHYELATRQWIDAFDDWENAINNLVGSITNLSLLPDPAPSPAAPRKRADIRISEQAIERARGALTHYIGPIALVLVRKAAASAHSLDDFHDKLAGEIHVAEDRTAFLALVRRNAPPASSLSKA